MGSSHSTPPINHIDYNKIELSTKQIFKTHINDAIENIKEIVSNDIQNTIFIKISEVITNEINDLISAEITHIINDALNKYNKDIYDKLEHLESTISKLQTDQAIDMKNIKTDLSDSLEIININTKESILDNNQELINNISCEIKDYINKKMIKTRDETKELINQQILITRKNTL